MILIQYERFEHFAHNKTNHTLYETHCMKGAKMSDVHKTFMLGANASVKVIVSESEVSSSGRFAQVVSNKYLLSLSRSIRSLSREISIVSNNKCILV